MFRRLSLLFLSLLSLVGIAQSELILESINLPLSGGLQSFAHAEYQGKFYLVGGRLDGLHQRQPFASFDAAGHNDEIWVIEPDTGFYKLSLGQLSSSIVDPLKSTNLNYYQEGDYLFLVGGYGISGGSHITHATLTIIDLSQLHNLSSGMSVPTSAIQQISHPDFAVCGGQLERIDSTFYLVGGHEFTGRYNPHNGPSFTQTYTNAVRRFRINGSFPQFQVSWENSISDPQLLHRRDYNVGPEIREDGSFGLIAYSGVFQPNVDLPYLNAVRINSSGATEIPNFNQYYNHYHCANVALYDAQNKAMHNLFFGGIAQYFEQNGVRTQDNNVPFVKTIASVSRDSMGNFWEHKFQAEMPALLGAGSEFFIDPSIPLAAPGIIDYNQLTGDTVFIGYIFGGIESSAANIFLSNTGNESSASSNFFKVSLIKSQLNLGQKELENPKSGFNWQLAPNPGKHAQIWYQEPEQSGVFKLAFRDESGRLISEESWTQMAGQRHRDLDLNDLPKGSYLVELYFNKEFISLQRWIYHGH
ncbi:hypothetical protein [Croceimicrobium hydrocarbonivorans]|uniref:T9SS C-terminal target domain-containing protein n=1 Tax=Croceimicrobium hydrocarbonivorans TaxID=2761580 RepID=A0A7H0VCD1_9FLAO|nr:hypothetical protein [Croceimicrobium hydrocarbonivorans]QNR23379.1 T9SS C-terminal target domain-containing protein [Croceimicrobium hydrocarbonivorans]